MELEGTIGVTLWHTALMQIPTEQYDHMMLATRRTLPIILLSQVFRTASRPFQGPYLVLTAVAVHKLKEHHRRTGQYW